jgi:hypothetical protein
MMKTMISRHKSVALLLGFAACVVLFAATAQAQNNGQQQAVPSQSNWSDSLRTARMENQALENILRAIESIDTARQNELIQWIITDRNIRSRVISALRKGGFRISPNSVAELTVTQKPDQDDAGQMQLLRLVIESIGVYGEPNIRRILGTNLYDQIASRQGYEYTLVSTEQVQQKIQFVYLDASLFGGDIIFKSGFGFGIKVGEDWIGYPFWLPGTMGTYGLLRRGTTDFRVGLEWPLGQAGVDPFVVSGGLQVRPRLLTGSMAFSAQIVQDLGLLSEQSGKLHFGAEFFNAFTPTINNFPAFANLPQYKTGSSGLALEHGAMDSLYYLALSTHAYVSYRLPDNVLRGAYVQLGGGMHSIQPSTIGIFREDQTNGGLPNNDLDLAERRNFVDPFIKLGYIHNAESGEDWGLSVQYCNTMLTDAWVKLFPWLQIEAKYSTVVFRDPYKWEWKDYVMVSPRLTLNF